ncbi:MAG: Zn-dependent oligopeptidase [Bacteroidetes bacterium]|nr:Zn-dependent oligopeptidase [Bacteroidota bacterium]
MNSANPFLRGLNVQINFKSVTAASVSEATTAVLKEADSVLVNLLKPESKNFENTLKAIDQLYSTIFRVFNPIYLLAETHPDEEVRNKSRESIEVFSEYLNQLAINEDIYAAVKSFNQTLEASGLSGYKKRYLDETLLGFKRSGFDLTKDDREKLKSIRVELDKLSLEFQKNIAESTDFIELEINETEGLPADFISSRKTESGKIKVDLSYPSFQPFMKYSKNEIRRKELWLKYNNRAFPQNLEILDQILLKRQELADLLGYPTFAHYALEDRMAKTPATVWQFEKELAETIRPKAELDYQALLSMKSELTGKPESQIVEWETSYISNQMKERKYAVDDQLVKQYFELNSVITGLFSINGRILGLDFREVENKSVWHEDVRQFEVIDQKSEQPIGTFYLDLFPRDNKYSHAAMFPLVGGCETVDGYEKPVAALVCNFPKPTTEQPSLLLFSDVNTFFHEFGHLLHGMVTTSPLQGFAGTNVLMDFVETPSQFFENFIFDYDTVTSFARHHQTNEPFPKELFKKILDARNMGSGIATQAQILYGSFDFTLHDGFIPGKGETTTDVLKKLKTELTLFPYSDGNHFHAAFGHLSGYAAGYYSYLWAKVYAQDIWSVFEETGALNPETGKKFRKWILEPGGTIDPLQLVREFLGREPNAKAFLKDLGV